MSEQPTVLKFGGTSVADAAAFERVVQVVGREAEARPVVVTSAMSKVTDALLAAVRAAEEGDPEAALAALEPHLERHRAVARELLGSSASRDFETTLDASRRDLETLLKDTAAGLMARPLLLQDAVVSHGERLSSVLLAAVLAEAGLPAVHADARRFVTTDEAHGHATPLEAETEQRTRAELGPLVERGRIPVLGGFIGATADGATTTLGRGGSDYTAALVGAALRARVIQIWTDVSGVLTADPRVVGAARTVPRLSYSEAAELAYFGAKVLHPKTVQPAVELNIPLRILNSRAPDDSGTLVCDETEHAPRTVKAIAHKRGITAVSVSAVRMLGAYGFLRALFEIFDRHRTAVDVVTTSEVSVSLTLDDTTTLPVIEEELRRLGSVSVERERAIVCVVGDGLRDTSGLAAQIFGALGDINVTLISLGASSVNLTFVVEGGNVEEAVRRLHRAFFEEAGELNEERGTRNGKQ
ncbi:MAG TPA: lysine-sensitive aspartokinase 3 [Pyrinomonadaceae bacterium]|nr:lysine-sensitive aspartokinase 3 [Pyrinomonadaceae bacterium]